MHRRMIMNILENKGGNNMSLLDRRLMMNPQNMLMNMLKQRNPQMFNQVNQMMNSGVNPNDFMKQMGVTPQQIEIAKQQAKRMFGNNIKF